MTAIASPPRGSPTSQVPARDGDLNEEAIPTPTRPTQGEAAVTKERDAGNGPASANPSSPSISRPTSDETPKKDETEPLPESTSARPSTPPRPPRSAVEIASDSAMERFADLIKSGKAKNVVILTGAGISTSAGIPDFRSPATGLYANLQRLNLPFPEAVFELNYFKQNPKPFWTLAKELYPGKHLPTPTHYFFLLLERHGVLRRVFSQNIDTLETIAGLPPSRVVEAHGSFASAHCLTCRKAASKEHVLRSGVRKGEVVRCGQDGCDGLVKPDIVFFGEGLPERFFQSLEDLTICDLLIVIGTSLQVHPFASLPNYVQPHVPRLLINREPVGPFSHLASSRSSNGRSLVSMLGSLTTNDKKDEKEEDAIRDRFWEGDADDGVRRMARELGWGDELEEMIKEGTERLEKEWADVLKAESADTEVKEVVNEVSEVIGVAGE